MDTLFSQLSSAFSVEYIFSVIVCSYLFIKGIDFLNGDKSVPTWQKRSVTVLVGLVLAALYYKFGDTQAGTLVSSFFCSVFVYDAAIAWLLKKLDIGYK